MKRFKNWQFLGGLALFLAGLGILAVCLLRTPAREITRAQLETLIQTKAILKGRATPTPYAGIYHLQGTGKLNDKPQKFFITTHLDEGQLKTLFAQSVVKVQIPGLGVEGQWIN